LETEALLDPTATEVVVGCLVRQPSDVAISAAGVGVRCFGTGQFFPAWSLSEAAGALVLPALRC